MKFGHTKDHIRQIVLITIQVKAPRLPLLRFRKHHPIRVRPPWVRHRDEDRDLQAMIMMRGRWQRVLLLELASSILGQRGLRYGRDGGGQGWRAPLLSPRKRAAQPQVSAGRKRRVAMCRKWDRRGCGRRLSPLAPTTRIYIRDRICARVCVPAGRTGELRRHGLKKKKTNQSHGKLR